MGDVREFCPPLPVLNPIDDFYCFALEWTFESPVKSQGVVHYAVRFGIDIADGEFVLTHGNRKQLRFTQTEAGIREAAEFVSSELKAEFSRHVVFPARRIGFVAD